MPVEKGQPWGSPGYLPADAPVADSDAALAQLIGAGHAAVGVCAGDLARTLGASPSADRDGKKQLLPIDAIEIELPDGSTHLGIAHVVVGSPLRHRESLAIMNAAFIGSFNVAPRAHPGDGRLDVVHAALSPSDRAKAWRRLPTGTHVPHPGIRMRRQQDGVLSWAGRKRIQVDGVAVGRASELRFRVRPEALVVGVS